MESRPNQSSFQPTYLSPEAIEREQAAFMTQVYGWMTVALLVTASISIWTASSATLLTIIFGNRLVFTASCWRK